MIHSLLCVHRVHRVNSPHFIGDSFLNEVRNAGGGRTGSSASSASTKNRQMG